MRSKWRRLYQDWLATALAVLLHVVVGLVLLFNLDTLIVSGEPEAGQAEVVQAVVVDEARLEAELERLAEADRRRQHEETERQASLERAAREVEERRRREEERLAELERRQAEEQERLEQARRQAEEAEHRAREEEQKRLALEKQRQEEQRKAEEAARKAKEEEQKRLALEKQRQEEQRKAEEAKRKAAEAERKAREEEAKRKAEEAARKAREEEAKRKAEQQRRQEEEARLQLAESLARQARERALQGEVEKYAGLIARHVRRVWRVPLGTREGLSCDLKIEMTAAGVVQSVALLKSSGDPHFDDSAIQAVYRASPLPLPADPEANAKIRSLPFRFRPED